MSTTSDAERASHPLVVEYCGERYDVAPGRRFTIGREADLAIDDNPFLHRSFLAVSDHNGLWFLTNVGSQLSATVADAAGQLEAFLAPGANLPLVFGRSSVAFTAGTTSYELTISNGAAVYANPAVSESATSATTVGAGSFTRDQHLMLVALAEPRLRGDGRTAVLLPSTTQAARRLGWTATRFNRKLDNVCDKLTKLGVRGLHGSTTEYAVGRRARLVEYAVATRIVTRDDIAALDALTPAASADGGDRA